jgi:hypothetical protein
VIGTDPKRFGFDLPSEEEMPRHYDVVQVPEITSLERLADLAGVNPARLRQANTELAGTATVTPDRNFPLYVPVGRGATLTAALAAAPEERPSSIAPIAPVEMASLRPSLRGDTIATVKPDSKRFGDGAQALGQLAMQTFCGRRCLQREERGRRCTGGWPIDRLGRACYGSKTP